MCATGPPLLRPVSPDLVSRPVGSSSRRTELQLGGDVSLCLPANRAVIQGGGKDKADCISKHVLIAPHWPRSLWFHTLTECATGPPLLRPVRPDVATQRHAAQQRYVAAASAVKVMLGALRRDG